MLAPHSVIPLVESNAMVIDRSSSVDCTLEVSIPLVFVELKLHGFHAFHSGQKWVAIG
jgi:hypothetical protein